MSEQRKYNLDLKTLGPFILKSKEVIEDIDFVRLERKKGVYKIRLNWRNAYTFMDGDVADGLFFEIDCRVYPDFTYHSFMLKLVHKKHVNVIYQLEVYPEIIESHRGVKGEVIFGSHIHNLHSTSKVEDIAYDERWYEWLKYFCKNANINLIGNHREPIIHDGLGI